MALLQTLASIVTRVLDEQMVLEHLLGHKIWQEALVCCLIYLCKVRLLACHLRECVEDLCWGVVSLCTEDASAKNGGTILDNGFDEFACS